MSLAIKVSFDGDIRRFNFPASATATTASPFESVLASVAKLYGPKLTIDDATTLKYLDDEGELVTIATNEELKDAMESVARSGQNVLKLFVFANKQAASAAPSWPSSSVQVESLTAQQEAEYDSLPEFAAAAAAAVADLDEKQASEPAAAAASAAAEPLDLKKADDGCQQRLRCHNVLLYAQDFLAQPGALDALRSAWALVKTDFLQGAPLKDIIQRGIVDNTAFPADLKSHPIVRFIQSECVARKYARVVARFPFATSIAAGFVEKFLAGGVDLASLTDPSSAGAFPFHFLHRLLGGWGRWGHGGHHHRHPHHPHHHGHPHHPHFPHHPHHPHFPPFPHHPHHPHFPHHPHHPPFPHHPYHRQHPFFAGSDEAAGPCGRRGFPFPRHCSPYGAGPHGFFPFHRFKAAAAAPAAAATAAGPSAAATAQGSPVHEHVQCDGCKAFPILGVRYKCTRCHNFDLCERCEATGQHPADHPLLKFRVPCSFSGRRRHCGGRRRFGGFGPFWMLHRLLRAQAEADGVGAGDSDGQNDSDDSGCGDAPQGTCCGGEAGPFTSSSSDSETDGDTKNDTVWKAALEKHKTLPDNSWCRPNADLMKVWSVKNTGTVAWPAGTRLVFVRGDLAPAAADTKQPLQLVNGAAPGEVVDVSVRIRTPPAAGSFVGYYQLQTAEGLNLLDQHLPVSVKVVDLNDATPAAAADEDKQTVATQLSAASVAALATPAASPAPAPAPVEADAEADAQDAAAFPYAEQLKELAGMGFTNERLVKYLLINKGGNLVAVLDWLLQH